MDVPRRELAAREDLDDAETRRIGERREGCHALFMKLCLN
jgi:hypothetical protein